MMEGRRDKRVKGLIKQMLNVSGYAYGMGRHKNKKIISQIQSSIMTVIQKAIRQKQILTNFCFETLQECSPVTPAECPCRTQMTVAGGGMT